MANQMTELIRSAFAARLQKPADPAVEQVRLPLAQAIAGRAASLVNTQTARTGGSFFNLMNHQPRLFPCSQASIQQLVHRLSRGPNHTKIVDVH